MRSLFIILFSLISVSVYANEANKYTISNTDVNRIVCPETIREVHSSDDKALQMRLSGNNLYVKFPVVLTEDFGVSRKTLALEPVGVFIDCGNVYNLLLYPADTTPQTITLSTRIQNMETVKLEVKGKPFEDVLTELIRIMAQNKYPAGVIPVDHSKTADIGRGYFNIRALLRRELNVYSFKVLELYLYSPIETSILDTELLQLSWWQGTPLATAVFDNTFRGWSRAVVVLRGDQDVR